MHKYGKIKAKVFARVFTNKSVISPTCEFEIFLHPTYFCIFRFYHAFFYLSVYYLLYVSLNNNQSVIIAPENDDV